MFPSVAMFNSKLLLISSALVLISVGFFSDYPSDEDVVDVEVIPIDGGAVGPESLAFDPAAGGGGGPYTGVSDGRIIKWEPTQRRWIDFAVTSPHRCSGEETEHICGRPLGLKWDERNKNLYVADAYMGLMVVGPNGGLATRIVSKVQGLPLRFTNGLDVDQATGLVYFTHSSQHYTRRDYMSIVISGDSSGSLIKYDPQSKEVVILLNNLSFPNGVVVSQNTSFILVAETTKCRILRLWLQTPKSGIVETFADLPGFPDNINRNKNGEIWVALYSRRGKFLKWIMSNPCIGHVISKLPIAIRKVGWYIAKWRGQGLVVKLGEDGEILEMVEDRHGKVWKYASEVMEIDGNLWIGSVINPFLVKHKVYK